MLTLESKWDSQQDWTAARCARLLRRISAPLNALRKLNAAASVAAVESKVSNTHGFPDVRQRPNKDVEGEKPNDEQKGSRRAGLDPDWIPALGGKLSQPSLGQKYSKRRSTAVASAPQMACAEQPISFGTPQLQRIANRPADSTSPLEQTPWKPMYHGVERQKCQARGTSSRRFAPFVRPTIPREKHLANLQRGIDDLLRTTDRDSGTEHPNTGGSSLLTTCLRRLPDFIRLEQEEQAGLAEDEQNDAATDLINRLEARFATSSRGWKYLRVVVRAQGLSMLVDAAREGLVPWSMLENQVSSMLPIGPTFETIIDHDFPCRPMSIVNTSTQVTTETTFINDLCQSYTALMALSHSQIPFGWQGEFLPQLFNHLERLIAEGRAGINFALAPSKSSLWQWAVASISKTGTLGISATRLLRTLLLASSGHPEAVSGIKSLSITNRSSNTLCATSIKSLMTIVKTLAGLALHSIALRSPISNERSSSSSTKARWLFLDVTLRLLSLYSSTDCTLLTRPDALSSRTKIVLTNILEICLMVMAVDGGRAGSFSPRHADRISTLLATLSKSKGARVNGNQSNFFMDALDIMRRIQRCDASEVLHQISSRVTERRSTGLVFIQRTEEHVAALLRMAGVQLGNVIERLPTAMKSSCHERISFAKPSAYDGNRSYRPVAVDDLGIDPTEVSQSASLQYCIGDDWYEISDDESSSVEDPLDAPFSSRTIEPALRSTGREQHDRYAHHTEEYIKPQTSSDINEVRHVRPRPKEIAPISSGRQPLRPMDRNIPMSSRQRLEKQCIVNGKLPSMSRSLMSRYIYIEEPEDSGYSSGSTVSTYRERRGNNRKRSLNLFDSVNRVDGSGSNKKQRMSGGQRSSLGVTGVDDDGSEDELSLCN